MHINALIINPRDNVAVATEALEPGGAIRTGQAELVAKEKIPAHHKVSVAAIAKGERVLKYGESIGWARADIAPGQWVHTHNLRMEEE